MLRILFERFTERARHVVVLAQEESRVLGHNYIGTEHILLGLMREEEGLAARVLKSLEITIERLRAEVVRLAPRAISQLRERSRSHPRASERLSARNAKRSSSATNKSTQNTSCLAWYGRTIIPRSASCVR